MPLQSPDLVQISGGQNRDQYTKMEQVASLFPKTEYHNVHFNFTCSVCIFLEPFACCYDGAVIWGNDYIAIHKLG